jgi:hypothetical protein
MSAGEAVVRHGLPRGSKPAALPCHKDGFSMTTEIRMRKLTGIQLRAAKWLLVAAASVWLSVAGQGVAKATSVVPQVVYGNLGNTGAGALGQTSTTTTPGSGSVQRLASGFTTGTSI